MSECRRLSAGAVARLIGESRWTVRRMWVRGELPFGSTKARRRTRRWMTIAMLRDWERSGQHGKSR